VVAVGLWSSRLWAVDLQTGETLWNFDEDGYGNSLHVEASDKVIAGFSRSDKAYAFDPRSGVSLWAEKIGDLTGGVGMGNVCLINDKLISRNYQSVYCREALTGKTLWATHVGGHYWGGLDCSDNGRIACANDRTLSLLKLETGEIVFKTKIPVRSDIAFCSSNRIKKKPDHIYAHPIFDDSGRVYVFTSDGVLWALKPEHFSR
jgi:outer membrane protein assembly factor BamB